MTLIRRGSLRNLIGRILAVALMSGLLTAPTRAADISVAAAASLIHVLPELANAFASDSGHRLRISYGASGNLARQIQQGAPFQVFLSANEEHIQRLVADGLLRGEPQPIARGRLVVYAAGADGPATLAELAEAVRAGTLRRCAIANPAHAPYGVAARKVLRDLEIWEPLRGRLVMGENVAQAAQFAASGSVDVALIALSLASSPELSARGSYFLVPADRHAPIRQTLALLAGADEPAERFARFLAGPRAGEILHRHGFEPLTR
jgi:molybdate transport system substrate-binding protein